MKKLFALTIALITFVSYSQTVLAPFLEKDKWGYITPEGEIVIEPQFKQASPFSEDGFAFVYTLKKKWQFINPKNEVLNVTYERFVPDRNGFHNGLAIVVFNKKKGVINTKGEEVIEPKYDFIFPFENGFTIAKSKDKFFILSKDGTETEIDFLAKRFHEGLAPIRNKDKKFGFINTKGEVVIEPKFLGVGFFNDGIAWARDENKKIGFINTKGEWIIEPKYLVAKRIDPETGWARVKNESGWLYVSKTGKELIVKNTIGLGDFHEGLAWARNSDKKIGFINAKGDWVIEPTFLHVTRFSAGYCAVKVEDKWGFINMKGEWAIKPLLLKVKNFKLIN